MLQPFGSVKIPWGWIGHAVVGQLVTVFQGEPLVRTTCGLEAHVLGHFVLGAVCWHLLGDVPVGSEYVGASEHPLCVN